MQKTNIAWTNFTSSEIEYRELPEFPGYRFGSDGSVWTRKIRRGRLPSVLGLDWKRMKPRMNGGYMKIGLCVGSKPGTYYLHILIAMAFHGPRPDGMEACHNDGKTMNCAPWNLRWDSHSNNQRDQLKHGTMRIGPSNNKTKLTENQVREIRSRLAGGEFQYKIAESYGVSQPAIGSIALGKSWSWVK